MKRCKNITGFTDYPIVELGDVEGQQAPIRRCKVLSYDGNKYVKVLVEGVETGFKRFYIYGKSGRCGQVKFINRRKLERMKS